MMLQVECPLRLLASMQDSLEQFHHVASLDSAEGLISNAGDCKNR